MNPSISVPTDNIYKFLCLFGLAIIIASSICFTTMYINTLDKKIYYFEKIKNFEHIEKRTPAQEEFFIMYNKLAEITIENENMASLAIGSLLAIGLALSSIGFYKWYSITQKRDDKISNLQLEKIELEVFKLKIEKEKFEKLDG